MRLATGATGLFHYLPTNSSRELCGTPLQEQSFIKTPSSRGYGVRVETRPLSCYNSARKYRAEAPWPALAVILFPISRYT